MSDRHVEPDAEREAFLDRALDDALSCIAGGRPLDVTQICAGRDDLIEDVREIVRIAEGAAVCRAEARPRIAGYEMLGELGRGAMGVVHLARQRSLDRLVALKVLPGAPRGSRARARFLQEAAALARLRHPNVVTVHDVHDDEASCAYAMEYVVGCSLAALVDAAAGAGSGGAIEAMRKALGADPPALAGGVTPFFTRIAATIAGALATVHAAGLLHRDVKPSNVVIRPDGVPVLLDFGLVRALDSPVRTEKGQFVGTPVFAAPEQLRPALGEIDGRADVYGLGATLFYCLARQYPFPGRDVVEILRAQDRGPAPSLRRIGARVPRDLETVVARSLEVDRALRYRDAGELAADLERVLELEPVVARPRSLVARFARRWWRTAAVAVASVALTLALVHAWLSYRDRANREREEREAIAARVASHVHEAELALLSDDVRWQLWRLDGVTKSDRSGSEWVPRLPLDVAERELDLALALDPASADAAAMREVVVSARRSIGDAEAAHSIEAAWAHGAVGRDPRYQGLHRYLTGDVAGALESWSRVDGANESLPFFAILEGGAFLEQGQPARAFARLRQAYDDWPEQGSLARDLADAALRFGDFEEAVRWRDRAARLGGLRPGALERFDADLALACGNVELADALLGRQEALGLSGPEAWRSRAGIRAARGDFEGAVRELQRVMFVQPTSLQAWKGLALAVDAWCSSLSARERVELWVAAVREGDAGRGEALRRLVRSPIGAHAIRRLHEESATAAKASGSPRGVSESFRILLDSLEIASMSTLPTFEQRRLAGLAAWIASPTNDREQVAAIAGAMARDVATIGASFVLRAAAVVLGLTWLDGTADAQSYAWSLEGTHTYEFQNVRGTLGDLDGDGVREVVLISPGEFGAKGRVDVRSGASGGLLQSWTGESPNDYFGHDADGVDDVDGDGFPDVVAAAPFRTEAITKQGKIYVYSGATGAILCTRLGPTANCAYGEHVAGIGDVTGDGLADVAISVGVFDFERGRVEVLVGSTGALVYGIDGEAQYDAFGRYGVSSGKDYDGDGRPELLTGAPGWATSNVGRAYLISGATGAILHTWDGASPSSAYGQCTVFGGDIDGDGTAEILVGDPQFDSAGTNSGRIFVFSGVDFTLLGTIDGLGGNEELGNTMSCVGDLDGDGRDELGVGIDDYTGALAHSGQLRIFNARTLRVMHTVDGEQANEYWGRMIVRPQTLGDVDGDGIPDVPVGTALFDNSSGNDVGKVGVIALAALGLETTPPNPKKNDRLALSTLGGVAKAPTIDVLVDLDGAPMFLVLGGVSRLDGNGERVLEVRVPGGLAGSVARVRSYALGVSGHVVKSPDAVIAIQ